MIVKKVMVGGTDSFDYTGTPAGTISANNGTISANSGLGSYLSNEAAKRRLGPRAERRLRRLRTRVGSVAQPSVRRSTWPPARP